MKRRTSKIRTPWQWPKSKRIPKTQFCNGEAGREEIKEKDKFYDSDAKINFGLTKWAEGKANNEIASFIKTRKVQNWDKAELDALLEKEPLYKKKRPYNKTMKYLSAHSVWGMRYYSKGQLEFLYRLGIILGFTGWKQIGAYLSLTDLSITEIQKRINSINNRIEARRYTNGSPTSTAEFLYIIKVGKYTKFGITNNMANRMKSYDAEFGSHKVIYVKSFQSRKLVRNIEREISKYYKVLGKITRGHEYTFEHPDDVLNIREFCENKVLTFAT